MVAKGRLIGACVTEKTYDGKLTQKLHVYVQKEFSNVVSCKGDQVIECNVFQSEIGTFKDKAYDLVGKEVNIIYDYSKFGIKLYSLEPAGK